MSIGTSPTPTTIFAQLTMRKQVQTNMELACYSIQLELQIAKYFHLSLQCIEDRRILSIGPK